MNGGRIADRLYGEIRLPPLAVAMSATPVFHRLDDVRQLGGCALVYPSATHTRREHSFGVCHLSGVAASHLQRLYPDLVDDDDVLCVQLAGLLHDLGHGPFSHLFEAYVGNGWCHETMGLRMLDLLLERHPELDVARHFAGAADTNIAFVKLLIEGIAPGDPWPEQAVGRPAAKRFLAEIVHSRTTGIDTDKLDYLARDALAVFGASNVLSINRIVAAMKLNEWKGHTRIAFDESVGYEVADIFCLRAKLHRQVYQHRAVLVAEGLLARLLRALDERPDATPLARIAENPSLFAGLGDSSILRLPFETDPTLQGAPRCAYEALVRRPWFIRVPVCVSLHTRPCCTGCGQPTAILDAFCRACGASTCDRPGVENGEGLLVPPESTLDESEVAARLRSATRCDALDVHIVDIHCGTPVSITDPHGRAWKGYDPLREILFVSSTRPLFHLHTETFLVPEVRHLKVVYSYLPVATPPDVVESVARAVTTWGGRVGHVTEL